MKTHVQQSGYGLGSEIVLTLVGTASLDLDILLAQVWQKIRLFEERFSRFQPTSELSKVNQIAGQWVEVSSEFLEVLTLAISFSKSTEGRFNPLILPALQRAGYVGSWPNPVQSNTDLDYRQREIHAIDSIKIEGSRIQIPEASALDFGGCGKGILLDQLADFLSGKTNNYWLSLGGDIICCGVDMNDQEWSVGIARVGVQGIIGSVKNEGGEKCAIATSGTTKRRGTQNDTEWHHIINPVTHAPAETVVCTATVCAPTAAAADVYAKCIVISGLEYEKEIFEKKGITAAAVQYDGLDGIISVYSQGSQIKLQNE